MTEMSTGPVILVADDDPALRDAVARTLSRAGYEVVPAADGTAALEIVRRRPVQVLLADLRMPGLDGLELLRAAKTIAPEVEVILITGHGGIEDAVAAMKEGAYDFLTKPFKRAALQKAVEKALEKQHLLQQNRALRRQLEDVMLQGAIIGTAPAMRRVLDLVAQVAPSNATVLILGESGTGKELIADALHRGSARREGPCIKVNCAALPETLLESELFGHEKGAFTGAAARKEGRFELAHGGTLFLDEIGDLSPATQAKLLRVLQDGTFERLGGTKTLKVDVRIVTATNKDLEGEVKAGRFREDLFYRLNVISIVVPPLRDRREDIPLLAQHFVQRYAQRNAKAVEGLAREALDLLAAYHWPGNVRELENVIERAVVLARDAWIGPRDLPEAISAVAPEARAITIAIGTPLEEVEQRLIEETLQHTGGDKTLAAKLLGITSRTIYRKLKREGPVDEDGEEAGGVEEAPSEDAGK
jgi:two-component system response regulator HydG